MTVEELLALRSTAGEVDRWLFDGELVERWRGGRYRTPAHAATVATVSALLGEWCRSNGRYRAYGCGCPFRLATSPDTFVTFDASVTPREVRVNGNFIDEPPRLAVEVIEFCEHKEDDGTAGWLVSASLRLGVPVLWLIDPFDEAVHVLRKGQDPLHLFGSQQLTGGDDLPGFSCSIAELFE